MSSKPSMLQPALVGGVSLGVASALPVVNILNCLCCALVLGGAILSVHLYMKDYPDDLPPISMGDGAVVGVLAGAIGGAVYAVVKMFVGLVIVGGAVGTARVLEALEEANIELPPFIVSMLSAGAVSLVGFLIQLPLSVVIYGAFGALGGLLGVAILGKRPAPPPAPQATAPTPPPPPGSTPPPPPTTPSTPSEPGDSESPGGGGESAGGDASPAGDDSPERRGGGDDR